MTNAEKANRFWDLQDALDALKPEELGRMPELQTEADALERELGQRELAAAFQKRVVASYKRGEGTPLTSLAAEFLQITASQEYVEDEVRELREELDSRPTYKHPGFRLTHGRDPIAGRDYDEDSDHCRDDYEFRTGTGAYSNDPKECGMAGVENDPDPAEARTR